MTPSALPDAVRAAVEAELGTIRSAQPVGGGCISNGCRVQTADGPVFLKHNHAAPAGMFAAEAEGLRALRAAAGEHLRVPSVLALGDAGDDGGGWIALEWLEPAPPGRDHGERLGRGLAAVHRTGAGGWGWERDNWIGSLPQPNHPAASWPGFWRDRRLAPQLDFARRARRLPGTDAEWERLFDRLPDLLAAGDDNGPSLLHGDLWSGNALSTSAGPAIIDPAVYRGHREVDLAMAALFGGFDRAFFAAYEEAWPLSPGAERRRSVYQLYYLLVHVNLFGGGYVAQTAETLRRVLS
ncbi:MAG TPA: fructosamine kinase family protein [Longimicrobium sp.]|nr:fructosamine kinase family protein [Longimicrobium sp.]